MTDENQSKKIAIIKGLGDRMELKRLSAANEFSQFRTGLAGSRQKTLHFKETAASKVAEIHLRFGQAYGLYDTASSDGAGSGENPMVGGFTIHSLGDYTLTHPVSGLGHLAPNAVFEGAQLWSEHFDAAIGLKLGFMLVAALYQARALVVYPVISPKDMSLLYKRFARVGSPFAIPFVETADGGQVWAQSMVLQGDDLRKAIYHACTRGITTHSQHGSIHYELARRPAVSSGTMDPHAATLEAVSTPERPNSE
jgi:hypothetical protein